MAVDRDNIRMFLVNGEAIMGEVRPAENPVHENTQILVKQEIHINHPFRVIPDGAGNISVAAIFIKEEWARINPKCVGSFMEVSILEKVKDIYVKYEQELWSSIILPGQSGIITN